jgi:hypothetical protein
MLIEAIVTDIKYHITEGEVYEIVALGYQDSIEVIYFIDDTGIRQSKYLNFRDCDFVQYFKILN